MESVSLGLNAIEKWPKPITLFDSLQIVRKLKRAKTAENISKTPKICVFWSILFEISTANDNTLNFCWHEPC